MGQAFPPLYGKSKFYEKKKMKAKFQIEKLQQKIITQELIMRECDVELDKINFKK